MKILDLRLAPSIILDVRLAPSNVLESRLASRKLASWRLAYRRFAKLLQPQGKFGGVGQTIEVARVMLERDKFEADKERSEKLLDRR
ncbi:MAG TPA: hypothetical protein VH500_16230 [Nitrososphaeraceae archaeon]